MNLYDKLKLEVKIALASKMKESKDEVIMVIKILERNKYYSMIGVGEAAFIFWAMPGNELKSFNLTEFYNYFDK